MNNEIIAPDAFACFSLAAGRLLSTELMARYTVEALTRWAGIRPGDAATRTKRAAALDYMLEVPKPARQYIKRGEPVGRALEQLADLRRDLVRLYTITRDASGNPTPAGLWTVPDVPTTAQTCGRLEILLANAGINYVGYGLADALRRLDYYEITIYEYNGHRKPNAAERELIRGVREQVDPIAEKIRAKIYVPGGEDPDAIDTYFVDANTPLRAALELLGVSII